MFSETTQHWNFWVSRYGKKVNIKNFWPYTRNKDFRIITCFQAPKIVNDKFKSLRQSLRQRFHWKCNAILNGRLGVTFLNGRLGVKMRDSNYFWNEQKVVSTFTLKLYSALRPFHCTVGKRRQRAGLEIFLPDLGAWESIFYKNFLIRFQGGLQVSIKSYFGNTAQFSADRNNDALVTQQIFTPVYS